MMETMIDFHTHILPGIDDGSHSVEESLEMLRLEMSQGVDTIFLTPHFYAQEQYPEQFLKRRERAMEQLQNAIPYDEAVPNFVLGAEVMYYPGMSKWEQLPRLALGQTGYILIEMPGNRVPGGAMRELEEIYMQRNLIPILAHVERYFQPLRIRELMDQLEDLPVLLQLNGTYLIDRHTRKHAISLLKQGRVQLIGSDCHSLDWRKPCMDNVRKILDESLDDRTLQTLSMVGQIVLRGDNIFVKNTAMQ